LYTTKHVAVMNCVNNFWIIETQKICIILYSSLLHILMVVLYQKTYSKVLLLCSYCTYVYVRKLLFVNVIIRKYQDNFVVNIKIFLNALSHSSNCSVESVECVIHMTGDTVQLAFNYLYYKYLFWLHVTTATAI